MVVLVVIFDAELVVDEVVEESWLVVVMLFECAVVATAAGVSSLIV